MTEKEIIKSLVRFIDNRIYPFKLANVFIFNWECDFFTITGAGETREFEIKISRSDYFKDALKDKHKLANGANYFYYVCPQGLIKREEVDKKYGLIYVWDTGFLEIIKKPRRLHDKPFDRWKQLAIKTNARYYEMWRQKFIDKEITVDEYRDGFTLSLNETDLD